MGMSPYACDMFYRPLMGKNGISSTARKLLPWLMPGSKAKLHSWLTSRTQA